MVQNYRAFARTTGLAAILLSALPLSTAACGLPNGETEATMGGSSSMGSATEAGSATSTGATTEGSATTNGESSSGSMSATGGTGTTVEPGSSVDLGTAQDYVILAKTGISTVPNSAVTGHIAVSPAAASMITGFSLIADPTNVFSTSTQVSGKVYAADFSPPTPSNLTKVVSDMELAFTDAAGRAPGVTELGAGDIGGMTLPSGVYSWGTGLLIPTDVTLEGSEKDVWIFQVAEDLTVSSGAEVAIKGGGSAKNVFWQVSGLVTLGTTSHMEGVVLTQTSVMMGTGASVTGRLLAQSAVNLSSSTVVEPAL